MRKRIHIVLWAVLATLLACQREAVPENAPKAVPAGEMPVRLAYTFPQEEIPDFCPDDTKASILGGEENTASSPDFLLGPDGKGALWMLCFDADNIYQGYRRATLEGTPKSYTHNGETCWGREFSGSVPGNTTRIHFVGNVPADSEDASAEGYVTSSFLPGENLIGRDEEAVITDLLSSYDDARRAILYWGFHRENSIKAMKEWLARDEKGIVHLLRDRAKVEFADMQAYYRAGENEIGYRILSIDWILVNGLKKGYTAAFQSGGGDLFDGYYDVAASPRQRENPHRPTPSVDRYSATEDQMMNVYRYDASTDTHILNKDNHLYLFEDPNDAFTEVHGQVNAPKIVLRVTYLKDRNAADTPSNRIVKYQIFLLQDGDNNPCKIYRNHSYKIVIHGLPWRGLGYETFEDALTGRDYINNRSISISDIVPTVSDGVYELTIDGSPYLLYHDSSDVMTTKTATFTYTVSDEADAHLLDGLSGSDFEVGWTNEEDISATFADKTVGVSYDPATRKGTVTFKLGTDITPILQEGVIKIHAKASGLSRFLNVYTITHFNARTSAGKEDLKLVATGQTRMVNGVACPEYRMSFRVPGNYPSGLYPLHVRIASTTLSPMAFGTDPNFGVEMAPTENGETLDGETLSGMDFSTTWGAAGSRPWNYRKEGDPWNYWHTYSIVSKPVKTEGGQFFEDVSDKEYTIYFADIRGLRAESNRADTPGLFLKIKYFGPAIPVFLQTESQP